MAAASLLKLVEVIGGKRPPPPPPGWVNVEHVAAETGVSLGAARHRLMRAYQAGKVERQQFWYEPAGMPQYFYRVKT